MGPFGLMGFHEAYLYNLCEFSNGEHLMKYWLALRYFLVFVIIVLLRVWLINSLIHKSSCYFCIQSPDPILVCLAQTP